MLKNLFHWWCAYILSQNAKKKKLKVVGKSCVASIILKTIINSCRSNAIYLFFKSTLTYLCQTPKLQYFFATNNLKLIIIQNVKKISKVKIYYLILTSRRWNLIPFNTCNNQQATINSVAKAYNFEEITVVKDKTKIWKQKCSFYEVSSFINLFSFNER